MKKIRVLIVDDSAAVREALKTVLDADPEIEVMATAADPIIAVKRLKEERPDVITLDVEMPQMDGVTFLRKIMSQHPIPVVMCSTLMEENSKVLLDALSAGAVDVIQKPKFGASGFLAESCKEICEIVKNASRARPKTRSAPTQTKKKLTADEMLPPPNKRKSGQGASGGIIAIGSSTGGTEALCEVLKGLPAATPPVVIVQHMPRAFTGAFAERLNSMSALSVKEAEHGDWLENNTVYLSPGGIHMLVARRGPRFQVELRDGPLVSRHKPSVDVLFRSVARSAGGNSTGVILTGMGDDGAKGLKEMRDLGAATIGQDEASCVVYGMPKAAMEHGAVEVQMPLDRIARRIMVAKAYDLAG